MTNRNEIVDSDDEGETADVLVCARLTAPLMMPDNLIDICSRCGEAIQYRPHAAKLPAKICLECAGPLMEAGAAKGDLVTMLTPTSAAEVAAFLRKRDAN